MVNDGVFKPPPDRKWGILVVREIHCFWIAPIAMQTGAQKDVPSVHSKPVSDSTTEEAARSLQFTEYEHSLGFWDAMSLYWPAVVWSMFINLVCPPVSWLKMKLIQLQGHNSQRNGK